MSQPVPDGLLDYEGSPLSAEELRRIPRFQRIMRSPFGAILFALTAFFLCVPALMYIGPPFLVLLGLGAICPRNFQKIADLIIGPWYFVMVTLFEVMLGIRTRSFGFNGEFKRRSIFIMNHISHFDWLFFWGVVERQGDLHIWKAVTKNMMKKMPFVGQCMQYGFHVFITRKWGHDLEELRNKLYYYNALNYPLQLLLFPEGGDLTTYSLKRSDKFADDNDLPRYKYCLHPRTTGLTYVINAMRDGELDAIYDITVGYPDLISKTELDFGKGHMPREIHYHIQEYQDSDLPQSEEGLAKWCKDRWREKEDRLKDFYTHRVFREWSTASKEGDESGSAVYHKTPEVFRLKKYLKLFVSLVYFIVSASVCLYLTYTYWLAFVYVLSVMAWMAYITYYGKGVDYWIMSYSQDAINQAIASGKRGLRFTANERFSNGTNCGRE